MIPYRTKSVHFFVLVNSAAKFWVLATIVLVHLESEALKLNLKTYGLGVWGLRVKGFRGLGFRDLASAGCLLPHAGCFLPHPDPWKVLHSA